MIEIHRPELEALIYRRMAAGAFESVEDFLMQAVEAAPETKSEHERKENLDQVFAGVRGLFADGELDFTRNPSPGRPVDLS